MLISLQQPMRFTGKSENEKTKTGIQSDRQKDLLLDFQHVIGDFWIPAFDGIVKSRHTGENRCPVIQQLSENTGFRISP